MSILWLCMISWLRSMVLWLWWMILWLGSMIFWILVMVVWLVNSNWKSWMISRMNTKDFLQRSSMRRLGIT